jgi:hypothetical protein
MNLRFLNGIIRASPGILMLCLPCLSKAGEPTYSISTDKRQYFLGEPIYVNFVWKNATSAPITLSEPMGFGHTLIDEAKHVLDFEVLFDGKEQVPFFGMVGHGRGQGPCFTLKPGESRVTRALLNRFDLHWGPYAFERSGNYSLKSTYIGSSCPDSSTWTGLKTAKDLSISVEEFDAKELSGHVVKARNGDPISLAVLGLHKQDGFIPALEHAYLSGENETKQAAALAILKIGSNSAVVKLGELTKSPGLSTEQKINLISLLQRSRNPVAISALQDLLRDPEVVHYSWHEKDGKKIYPYLIRTWAVKALEDFGVKVSSDVVLEKDEDH